MNFEFQTAEQIIFGPGSVHELVKAAPYLGKRCLVVTGSNSLRWSYILDGLKKKSVFGVLYPVPFEPTTGIVNGGVALARENGCDSVIAIGGGSAIDAGKAIAALMTNTGDIYDYLEIVGKALPLGVEPAPYMAAPTTAGTGSEVTKNAVIRVEDHGVKVSLRSNRLLPRLVVVDPELTYSLPPSVTASTGLDALTQLLESFVSISANPLTDSICREGLARASSSLIAAYKDPVNAAAREDMCLASLFSGIALANARLGAVHGFAAAAGTQCNVAHGSICASLLPHVVETNIMALRSRCPSSGALSRYEDAARIMTGRPSARAEDSVAWIHNLCREMSIPSLSHLGIHRDVFRDLASKAARASSMKGNPIVLTDDELAEILEKAQ